MNTSDDDNFARDLARARDENTDFLEVPNDLPPPDRYHAARDLADLLKNDLPARLEEIGLPDVDPARWESLDIARAASFAREAYPNEFSAVVASHPWLENSADQSAHDALGALGDRFLGG